MKYMKQLFNLIRQHRFYTAVCIVGTAITLAFVMVVVMVYDFRTADVAPEPLRSRTTAQAARSRAPMAAKTMARQDLAGSPSKPCSPLCRA